MCSVGFLWGNIRLTGVMTFSYPSTSCEYSLRARGRADLRCLGLEEPRGDEDALFIASDSVCM